MIGLSKIFRRRSPEVRESYADQIVARLLASAGGSSDGGALAAIETAARWWGLGLSSASVSPVNSALSAVSASVLDGIGRSLCRSGESLHVIDVSGGRVRLISCCSWSVHGGDDPASWRYRVTLNGPDSTRTITREDASVLHVRYAPHPSRPWGRTFTRASSHRHGARCGASRNRDGWRARLHTNANAHSETRCGRLRRGRSYPRYDVEDRRRIRRTRPHRRVRTARRRHAVATRT